MVMCRKGNSEDKGIDTVAVRESCEFLRSKGRGPPLSGDSLDTSGLAASSHPLTQSRLTSVSAPHLLTLPLFPIAYSALRETALCAAQSPSRKMSACGRKALTLLSSVFAVCGLGLLGIAVSTDYWLYLEEGIILPQNQSTEVKMSLHSGLWRVCFLAGKDSLALGNTRPKGVSPSLRDTRRCQ